MNELTDTASFVINMKFNFVYEFKLHEEIDHECSVCITDYFYSRVIIIVPYVIKLPRVSAG